MATDKPHPKSFESLVTSPLVGRQNVTISDAFAAAWGGIAFAGAVYPIVVISFFVSFNFIGSGPTPPIVELFVGMVVACIAGFCWAAFVSLFAAAIVLIIDVSFGQILNARAAAAVCGGVTGFFATFPISFGMTFSDSQWYLLELYTLLAMVMGNWGAIISASRSKPKTYGWQARDANRYQFQIRHLFVGTTWAAVLVAVDQLGPRFHFLTCVSVGAAIQTLMMLADGIWIKIRKSKQKRRTDSELPT